MKNSAKMVNADSFDDTSFFIGEEEGFCSSLSVCDSDISETDDEAEDFDDASWFDDEKVNHGGNVFASRSIAKGSECDDVPAKHQEISFCIGKTSFENISDTESETDSDEDDIIISLTELNVNERGASEDISQANEDLTVTLEDLPCDTPPSMPKVSKTTASSSFSGEIIYTTFYTTALISFLAHKRIQQRSLDYSMYMPQFDRTYPNGI